MPYVKIFNNQDPELDKTIEFDFGDETLAEILKRYDPSCDKSKNRVAIGNEIFRDWDASIDTCLLYGNAFQVSIHPFLLQLNKHETQVSLMYKGRLSLYYVSLNYTTRCLREIIAEKEGINVETLVVSYSSHVFKSENEDKALKNFGITEGAMLYALPNHQGGSYPCFEFADVTKSGQRLPTTTEGPKWRIVKHGLCLEGKCTKRNCQAYNNLVIMNMGLPVCYRLGMPGQKATNCPMCNEHVDPVTCGFYWCSFRYVGIIKTDQGPKRVKSEWQTVEKDYYRFNESKQSKWISLALETKNSDESITQSIQCGICLYEIKDTIKTLECKHKFHASCINERLSKNAPCPLCRISF